MALTLFALTLMPLVYWNTQHDWLSFGFHLSSRFDGGSSSPGFNPLTMVGVWLVGVAYLFPSLGFPLWWVSGRSLWQLGDLRQRFVLWLGLPIAAGFTLLGGMTHIYPAWPAPGLWSLSLLLALAVASWSPSTIRRWLLSSALVMATLLLFALGHVALGTLQQPGGMVQLMPPETDPTTTMIDVVQLRRRLQAGVAADAIASADFLVTNEFWLSGYIDMAVSSLTPAPVMAFTQDPRGHAVWFTPTDWVGYSGLFIATQRAGATTETFYLYDVGKLIAPYQYPY